METPFAVLLAEDKAMFEKAEPDCCWPWVSTAMTVALAAGQSFAESVCVGQLNEVSAMHNKRCMRFSECALPLLWASLLNILPSPCVP